MPTDQMGTPCVPAAKTSTSTVDAVVTTGKAAWGLSVDPPMAYHKRLTGMSSKRQETQQLGDACVNRCRGWQIVQMPL